jgi:hypothetical protein
MAQAYRKIESRIPLDIAILNEQADSDGINRQTAPVKIIAEYYGYSTSRNEAYKDVRILEAMGKLAVWPPKRPTYKGYVVMPPAEIDEPLMRIVIGLRRVEQELKPVSDNIKLLGELALKLGYDEHLFQLANMVMDVDKTDQSSPSLKQKIRQLGGVDQKLSRLSDNV